VSGFGKVPVFDEAWGVDFEVRMVEYMNSLYFSLDAPIDVEVETISGEIFCGCETCDFRERYLMATKLIIEGYQAGKVRLE
jgi:hypothetical protein